jgi:hypothetical protein
VGFEPPNIAIAPPGYQQLHSAACAKWGGRGVLAGADLAEWELGGMGESRRTPAGKVATILTTDRGVTVQKPCQRGALTSASEAHACAFFFA